MDLQRLLDAYIEMAEYLMGNEYDYKKADELWKKLGGDDDDC